MVEGVKQSNVLAAAPHTSYGTIPEPEEAEEEHSLGFYGWLLTLISVLIVIITFPFSLLFCLKSFWLRFCHRLRLRIYSNNTALNIYWFIVIVQEYERAVIFKAGRLRPGGALGPGIFCILPCIDNFIKVELRTVSFDVPPQEILSKDSVTVSVDAVVYFRVSNPISSVVNVENATHSTRLLAQTTLRNVLGTKSLSEILVEREQISQSIQGTLDEATDPWGVKVERVEVKDVRLPQQLQRAMAAEAEASREARAKVIAAEGEMNAARALKEASEVITESPSALQLRYLQTLQTISAEKNSTIIFPLPIDMISNLTRH